MVLLFGRVLEVLRGRLGLVVGISVAEDLCDREHSFSPREEVVTALNLP